MSAHVSDAENDYSSSDSENIQDIMNFVSIVLKDIPQSKSVLFVPAADINDNSNDPICISALVNPTPDISISEDCIDIASRFWVKLMEEKDENKSAKIHDTQPSTESQKHNKIAIISYTKTDSIPFTPPLPQNIPPQQNQKPLNIKQHQILSNYNTFNAQIPLQPIYNQQPYMCSPIQQQMQVQHQLQMPHQMQYHMQMVEKHRQHQKTTTKQLLDMIGALSNALFAMDDNNNGKLDSIDFCDALAEFDSSLTRIQSLNIYQSFIPSAIEDSEEIELDIQIFLIHIRNNVRNILSTHHLFAYFGQQLLNNGQINKYHFLQIIILESISSMSSFISKQTIIAAVDEEEEHFAINLIKEQLLELSEENNNKIDFHEFVEFVTDLKLDFAESYLKFIFEFYIFQQNMNGSENENELNVDFFIKEIKKCVTQESNNNLCLIKCSTPVLMLTYVFDDIFHRMNGNHTFMPKKRKKRKKKRKSVLNEEKNNPYLDTAFIETLHSSHQEFEKQFSKHKSITHDKDGERSDSGSDLSEDYFSETDERKMSTERRTSSKGDRKLIRMESQANWTRMDVEQQVHDMQQELRRLSATYQSKLV